MKRILLRKKGQYKLEKIRETFRNYFDGKVELPENIGEKGEIQGKEIRWQIRYVLIKNEQNETCLDFTAYHRMTNPRHQRIKPNGEISTLEMYCENYSYDPKIPGDKEKSREEYFKHNRKIGRMLVRKGLEDMKGNEELFNDKKEVIYNRSIELKNKFNRFLENVNVDAKDFYDEFSQEEFINLKMALADINNVLTLKTTLAFGKWLGEYFNFTEDEKKGIIENINSTKPNTNGFDIRLDERKILVEIKSIVPINSGSYYGAAQRNSILDDAIKLVNGKKGLRETAEYIKFIGLLDIDGITDKAMERLTTESKNIKTKDQKRLSRHEIVKRIKIYSDGTKLSNKYIYLKKVKI